jgi:NAD(P)-dependent dehydrogenase (short-subunit alcohol dehydrogenase family)
MPVSRDDCSRSQRQGGSRPDRDDALHKRRHHAAGEQCRDRRNGALLDSDVEKMDEMIRLNVGALARLAYAAAPGFVARGDGTIVNMDSSFAISPETLNGVYGGTKAFVLALSVSLNHELAGKGRASSGSPAGSDGGGSIRSIPTGT